MAAVGKCGCSLLTPVGVLYICPEEPLKFTCESDGGQLIDWRIAFSSLSLSDETHTYVQSDREGRIHTVERSRLNMVFNLTLNNQSQLVSTLTVSLTNDTGTEATNATVYCGQESHLNTEIIVRGS